MFTFTSMGGRVNNNVNKCSGSYVFKISSQNYHAIGSLLPIEGEKPWFAQLYVYDTEHEIHNRISLFSNESSRDQTIAENLLDMLNSNNEFVKSFRMVRDRFRENDLMPVKLKLIDKDPGMVYNIHNLPQ